MKLLIAGSRTFDDYPYLKWVIDPLIIEHKITEIISGGAKGADKLAEKYAKDHNLNMTVVPADWNTYGKSAGYRRNKQMVDMTNFTVVFWDGKSRGTEHTINLAREAGKLTGTCFFGSGIEKFEE